jgi:ArsR family metal-binding transcriptional regulator
MDNKICQKKIVNTVIYLDRVMTFSNCDKCEMACYCYSIKLKNIQLVVLGSPSTDRQISYYIPSGKNELIERLFNFLEKFQI